MSSHILKEQLKKPLESPKVSSQKTSKNQNAILIRGAKEHNLKNLNLTIPHKSLVVITGLSGSGKSSLAFDTIFAEGQRRYVESLSSYARQFIETLEKPELESIEGLSPTIAIQQKTTSYNPRSTVGTVTEIYDYLRLLYARISESYCHSCGNKISSQTTEQILEQLLKIPENTKISILSPIVRNRKGEYQKELTLLRQKGFSKVKIDNEVLDLASHISLDKQKKHSIDVYVDRLILRTKPDSQYITLRGRLLESIETSIKLSDGLIKIELSDSNQEILFSKKFACVDCGISYPEPEPRTFSFNSPQGSCHECHGVGTFTEFTGDSDNEEDIFNTALYISKKCKSCNGTRLKKESLYFKVSKMNIAELCELSIDKLLLFFNNLELSERETLIADRILKEIKSRLGFLLQVGVSYLSLSRSAQSLSGGESQRIRLATQIGSSLIGVTYILDEPSIGLHQRDNDKLISTLERLRNMGNTVIVVEHDKDTIEKADYIIDLGPGAGTRGGEITAEGTLEDILKSKKSLTAQYLTGKQIIEIPSSRRPYKGQHCIEMKNVFQNNLKNIHVKIPLELLTCVTGVSGSGKSTLIIDTLYPLLMKHLYKSKINPINIDSISGLEHIDKVIDIDQSPIGRTPRSNPATYTGVFSIIRDLFSQLPESKMRGFKPGRFSFNVKGGRCEKCQGGGMVKVEMHFLSNIYVKCDLCNGVRFNSETLMIKYKEKSISDVLAMTIESALDFFINIPSLKQKFTTLCEVGLGYITLGQSALTLSGGEAQRLKLAKELSKRSTGRTLYILDEPSTGLHFDDIRKLIQVIQRLVDQKNTVLIIEHNLEIIKTADHIIDLGPEGGDGGGQIIAEGTPEAVAKMPHSYTAKYLKTYL